MGATPGIATGVLIGVAVEKILYRPLVAKAKGPSFLQVFLTGWTFVLIGNSFGRMIWGSTGYILDTGLPIWHISLGSANLSSDDLIIVSSAWILTIATYLFIRYTALGRSIAAVRSNFEMAQVVGIDPNKIYTIVFALFSFLTAVAGVFQIIKFLVVPDAGDQPIYYAFVAVFIAGVSGGVFRFATVGLLIGIISNIVTYRLDVKFSPVFVFGILFIVVALLPYLQKIKISIIKSIIRPSDLHFKTSRM
ncbi:MAG: branched-chain amino acid ABC transporter permease [Syntrophales bacterium]|jgi:branched-chain amino acid transport system permease protein|nr:branched-chain amino acid ABC transporter permease [Syntrophales bacterium]